MANTKRYIGPIEVSMELNFALNELKTALGNVKNPEDWAEKYSRTASEFIHQIENVTETLERMTYRYQPKGENRE